MAIRGVGARLDALFCQDLTPRRQWWDDLRDSSGARLSTSAHEEDEDAAEVEVASLLTLERAGENGGMFVADEVCVSLAEDASVCIELLQTLPALADTEEKMSVASALEKCERRCQLRWLRAFERWPRALGNGIGLPELLFLCLCYMRGARAVATPSASLESVHGIAAALSGVASRWNHFLPDTPPLVEQLAHLKVLLSRGRDVLLRFCGHMDRFQPHMVQTSRRLTDMTVLAIGVDVHEQFDNRVHDLRTSVPTDAKEAVENNTDLAIGSDSALPHATHNDADRQLMCTIISDSALSPSDPMELLRIVTRMEHSYTVAVGLLLARTKVSSAVESARRVHQVESECLLDHVRTLCSRHVDESICLDAAELIRWQLLSAGALDYMARFTGLPRHSITGATALRFDHWRMVQDLSACHQLAHVDRTCLWEPAKTDALPALCAASDDVIVRKSLLGITQSMWTLVVLNQECQAVFGVELLKDYVILPQDLLKRARLCTQQFRRGRPRRPLIVNLLGRWMVFDRDQRYVCDSLIVALVLWCKLMCNQFKGRTESDVNIDSLLLAWHTPK